MIDINYEALYENIIKRKPKNNEQLRLFIKLVTEMSNNNKSNPIFYDIEALDDYAKIFNRMELLNKILH